MEGCVAFTVRNVGICTPVDQESRDRDAVKGCCTHIGAMRDQVFDDCRMTLSCGPHDSGLSFARFYGVYVRAASDQQINDLNATRTGGDHERRLAIPASGGRVGTSFK